MDLSKIEAFLNNHKKSVRVLFAILTFAVAGLLCYRLGENVGEFLGHIIH